MTLIELTLLLALAQQPRVQPTTTLPSDHQVALVFNDTDTRRMRLDEARRTYRRLSGKKTLSDEDARLHAALTFALGTLPDAERLSAPELGTKERLDWEIRRGVRRPLQESGRQ